MNRVIKPIGYQHATPLPVHTSVSDSGSPLTVETVAGQHDVLVRFEMAPSAIGLVPLHLSHGTTSVDWTTDPAPADPEEGRERHPPA